MIKQRVYCDCCNKPIDSLRPKEYMQVYFGDNNGGIANCPRREYCIACFESTIKATLDTLAATANSTHGVATTIRRPI